MKGADSYGITDGVTSSGDRGNLNDYGGKCDDTIQTYGANILFNSTDDDGNDTIQGFRADSILNVTGTYSTLANGQDIIVTVGEGKITLQGAAALDAVRRTLR